LILRRLNKAPGDLNQRWRWLGHRVELPQDSGEFDKYGNLPRLPPLNNQTHCSLYFRVAFNWISTPANALDTGQSVLAFSACCWNSASASPGTLASVSSSIR
jgi:hypothetical protein